MAPIKSAINAGELLAGEVVLLNFKDVAAINGSFIKATAYWLHLCGQLSVLNPIERPDARHPADPVPFDLYPVIFGVSGEVLEEIVEFFRGRRAPVLIAISLDPNEISQAVVEGHLDPALRFALSALVENPNSGAPELHALNSKEKVTATAWNNRLADLHRLRLATRQRCGRTFHYKSISKKVCYGRSISGG
jgi:hypothetical protein